MRNESSFKAKETNYDLKNLLSKFNDSDLVCTYDDEVCSVNEFRERRIFSENKNDILEWRHRFDESDKKPVRCQLKFV